MLKLYNVKTEKVFSRNVNMFGEVYRADGKYSLFLLILVIWYIVFISFSS